jgi:hypothetical protein
MLEESLFDIRQKPSCDPLVRKVQTGSGVHPASYSVAIVGSFHGVKQPKHEADHLSPPSAEFKNLY